MTYEVYLTPFAQKQLEGIDKSERLSIAKKLVQLQRDEIGSRHLKFGLKFNVVEVGQYRICFKVFEEKASKEVRFIGNHKEYEHWYKDARD
ncbi:MAG: hypothetical protein V1835_04610 [Candidatus Micrarchaeota archaeon]